MEGVQMSDYTIPTSNTVTTIDPQATKIREQEEHIKRLEEALTWYEYTVSNCYCHGSEGDAARDALRKDQGRKAKEAKP
jgi:hypothetical protein